MPIDLGVSLDGCKKAVEKIKTGVKYDRVIRNMKLLKKHGINQEQFLYQVKTI